MYLKIMLFSIPFHITGMIKLLCHCIFVLLFFFLKHMHETLLIKYFELKNHKFQTHRTIGSLLQIFFRHLKSSSISSSFKSRNG